ILISPHRTMSCVPVMDDGDEVCANCGKQGSDSFALKNCTACLLVKYCGVDCQRAHRKQHKKTCKQRAAELEDKRLYSQGHERPEGDFCPICTLPIPLPTGEHSTLNACCMKFICRGCYVAAGKRGMKDCPYCRTRSPDNDADELAMIHARTRRETVQAPSGQRQGGRRRREDGPVSGDKQGIEGLWLTIRNKELGVHPSSGGGTRRRPQSHYELRACCGRNRSLRQLRQARERLRRAQELHGLPPRQVLRRGLPEGPPQAAQEGMQAACGRARGRATVQSGAGEAGG
ncbi:hypothetical protein THAOC_32803, partial [Thalassiosira oceanica]